MYSLITHQCAWQKPELLLQMTLCDGKLEDVCFFFKNQKNHLICNLNRMISLHNPATQYIDLRFKFAVLNFQQNLQKYAYFQQRLERRHNATRVRGNRRLVLVSLLLY